MNRLNRKQVILDETNKNIVKPKHSNTRSSSPNKPKNPRPNVKPVPTIVPKENKK